MVATVPGGPKTSITTCFGLNGTMSFAELSGVDTTSCEPKIPFKRKTANAAMRTTTRATRIIQCRINRDPIETRCIRDPFDERRHVDGQYGNYFNSWTISTWLTVRYGTAPHNLYIWRLIPVRSIVIVT